MIEFLTLFLGLFAGPQVVGVAVGDDVARVELLLDGERAAVMTAPPWRAEVDFGEELLPHELAAVALNDEGDRVGRVSQRVNLPRSDAEVSLLLEHDGAGQVAAVRFGWESSAPGGPLATRFWLDGEELPAPSGDRIVLPPYEKDAFHLFEAEIEFAGAVTARAEVGFGGHLGEAGTQLTAVPIELVDAEVSLDPAAMSTWFQAGGESLEVMAVESGSAEVVLVRDTSAAAALRLLPGGPGITAQGRKPGLREARIEKAFEAGLLGADQRFRILYPVPQASTGHELTFEIFPLTPPVDAEKGGIYWHTTPEIEIENRTETRLTDAVAVAGCRAAAAGHRRAVLLILGPRSRDTGSRFSPQRVRRFLEALRVPLIVWYVGREKRAPREWGEPVVISSFKGFEEAVEAVRSALERQRVVWVDGSFLLREIGLSRDLPAIRLVE